MGTKVYCLCKTESLASEARTNANSNIFRTWDTVGIDLIGPFPETKTGYKYVLTVTDFFSHYTIVAPLSDKSARTVAYNLSNHVTCVHSCPKKFMSDRGTEFLNDIINRETL
jgi:IS30 family transposase